MKKRNWYYVIPPLETPSGHETGRALFSDSVPYGEVVENVIRALQIMDIVCETQRISPIGDLIIKAIDLNGELGMLDKGEIEEIRGLDT